MAAVGVSAGQRQECCNGGLSDAMGVPVAADDRAEEQGVALNPVRVRKALTSG